MTTPTPPDTFRALCKEMADILVDEYGHRSEYEQGLPLTESSASNLLTRARAALEAQPEPGVAKDRIAELEAELERERLRLAACGVVALADTPESAAKARDMHPDYRSASLDDVIRQSDALMTARALLSQLELTMPSNEQVEKLAGELEIIGGYIEDEGGFYVCVSDLGFFARAVLARWGRPAALAQPEPVAPTDEELEATARAAEVQSMKKQCGLTALTPDGIHAQLQEQRLAGLRAIAARWGRPAIEPIPVSERLPGPEDCDAGDCCWAYDKNEKWLRVNYGVVKSGWTHWLPHWALPIPRSEERYDG
jgi:hypothetical protein